jgi:hypothetical protein
MRFPSRAYLSMVLALSALVCVSLWGCNSRAFKSVWLKPTAVVQGSPDWWNLPAYRIDELNGSLTLVNDNNTLYLRFYSNDRFLAGRFKRAGLTLRLINPQNKSERVAIRYPMGMDQKGPEIHPNRFLPSEPLPATEVDEMLKLQSDDVVIEARDTSISGRKTSEQAARLGVQPQLNETQNAVEYQIAFTWSALAPWLAAGKHVTVELDSPLGGRGDHGPEGRHMERPPMGGNEGGGGGGDEGGRGFPGGGRRGGERSGQEPEGGRPAESTMNKAIHYEFSLELASSPEQP